MKITTETFVIGRGAGALALVDGAGYLFAARPLNFVCIPLALGVTVTNFGAAATEIPGARVVVSTVGYTRRRITVYVSSAANAGSVILGRIAAPANQFGSVSAASTGPKESEAAIAVANRDMDSQEVFLRTQNGDGASSVTFSAFLEMW